jgi:hypothetical protein
LISVPRDGTIDHAENPNREVLPMGSDVDISGGLDVDLGGTVGISGIPNSFDIDITNLPKLTIGVDPLAATLTLEPVTLNPVTLNPVSVNLAITEIASQRMHLPADFTVGLSVLGLPLMNVRLCGEAQMINEPYRPNPCEHCGESSRVLDIGRPDA